MNPARLLLLGVAIIFVGFAVLLAGALSGPSAAGSSGGFILIGPIPIVFGSGPNSGMLAAVGVAITVVMVALYLVSFFLWRAERRRETEMGREPE